MQRLFFLKIVVWAGLLCTLLFFSFREHAAVFIDEFFEYPVSSYIPGDEKTPLITANPLPMTRNDSPVSVLDQMTVPVSFLSADHPIQLYGNDFATETGTHQSDFPSLNPLFGEQRAEEQAETAKVPPSFSFSRIKDRQKLDAIAPMVALVGGTFRRGSDHGIERDQQPAHFVRLRPFRMDQTEVTNRQFQLFVTETGYRTTAERTGWSFVFDLTRQEWLRVVGACWFNRFGDDVEATPLRGAVMTLLDHPVVHVSWEDAQAFCYWSQKRLPTEAEWEYAAKGGKIHVKYPWGDLSTRNAVPLGNYWQGWFPDENLEEDGYLLSASVGSFDANPYGLFDLGGNVAEWCYDYYSEDYYRYSFFDNPLGPAISEASKVSLPVIFYVGGAKQESGTASVPERVIRGGSFLSAENNGTAYRVTARTRQAQPLSFLDIGFRCAE